jgi:hypothetical protein
MICFQVVSKLFSERIYIFFKKKQNGQEASGQSGCPVILKRKFETWDHKAYFGVISALHVHVTFGLQGPLPVLDRIQILQMLLLLFCNIIIRCFWQLGNP